jgi:hypothetical protein
MSEADGHTCCRLAALSRHTEEFWNPNGTSLGGVVGSEDDASSKRLHKTLKRG